MTTRKRTLLITVASLVTIVTLESCRPRRTDRAGVRGYRVGSGCVGDAKSTADRMGFRVLDGDHGAVVSCVEPSMGLHQQYGLKQGDVIVELNRHTPVLSAADFAAKVTQLENDLERPIAAWEFVVTRGGQKVTLAPKPAWVACGVISFERCGSVVNKAN